MDTFYKRLTIVLVFGLFLSELDQIFYLLYPKESISPSKNLYMDSSYTTPITPVYYMYELTDIINKSIWAFVLCLISAKLNYKFYLTACVFLFFRLSQIPFYIINRNSSFLNNIVLYVSLILTLAIWVKPFRKSAKIIKMQN